jgi:hypothetical protein
MLFDRAGDQDEHGWWPMIHCWGFEETNPHDMTRRQNGTTLIDIDSAIPQQTTPPRSGPKQGTHRDEMTQRRIVQQKPLAPLVEMISSTPGPRLTTRPSSRRRASRGREGGKRSTQKCHARRSRTGHARPKSLLRMLRRPRFQFLHLETLLVMGDGFLLGPLVEYTYLRFMGRERRHARDKGRIAGCSSM